jgi:hypothetical protein
MKRSFLPFVVATGLAVGVVTALATGLAGCGTSGGSDMVCNDDHCVCSTTEPCSHNCSPGGNACEIQCTPGQSCNVGCAPGEHCHVECATSASCNVDCGSSPECHVTCPATGCTVHNCVGDACVVTCGDIALPHHNGSTATCP